MTRGWLKKSMKKAPLEPTTFVTLGVTMIGDWRDIKILESFTLRPSHLEAHSPLLVDSREALEYDYLMIVPEKTARLKGWIK